MKHEFMVEQPVLDLLEGLRVNRETAFDFQNDLVRQTLRQLVLVTDMEETGVSGLNRFASRTTLTVFLNPGDILLFDGKRGYYLPSYPVTGIDEAISDITSLGLLPRYRERG